MRPLGPVCHETGRRPQLIAATTLCIASMGVPPLLAQHAEPQDARQRTAIGKAEAIARGKQLFAGSCAVCHGPGGQGGRGPNLRQQVMWHSLTDDEMFATIQKGVAGAGMPAANLPAKDIWQLVAFVRWLAAPAVEAPPPGNVVAGEKLFRGKAACSKCHQILGRGGLLGPDLSDVGVRRSVEQIREAVIDPDADGFRGYRRVDVLLNDGRTIKGVARNRTNYSIQLLDEDGSLHLVPTSNVKELTMSEHSPMPRDYEEQLSRQELDDLVAFLEPPERACLQLSPGEQEMMRVILLWLALSGVTLAQVRYADILESPEANWLTNAGDYRGTSHSPLSQITTANAGSLVPKWVYHVPKANGLRTRPIVHDGVMYVTNTNEVRALDARTGRLIWSYKDIRSTIDEVNRGVAILDDRVFFVTGDVHLVALDRRTGGVLWQKPYGKVEDGLTANVAPLAVKNRVIVGVSGGEMGMRGYVAALSATTGEEEWRFYTVPAKRRAGC